MANAIEFEMILFCDRLYALAANTVLFLKSLETWVWAAVFSGAAAGRNCFSRLDPFPDGASNSKALLTYGAEYGSPDS